MNTIRELTQQEKYNTMLKRKNKKIKELEEENTQISMLNADLEIYLKEHKARIDKAIEYIEKQEDYFNNYPLIDRQYLLDILKGSNSND